MPVLLDGLKRLEYRGYDSAGVAILENTEVKAFKKVGRVENLLKAIETAGELDSMAHIGVAHTRWATHGKPSEENAHPHSDEFGKFWLVHNGIIENYEELKKELSESGVKFSSETDTEVVVQLIAKEMEAGLSFEEAFRVALKKLRGAYGIVVMSADEPEYLMAARNSSPLLIGVGDGEMIVASDASAVVGTTKKIVYLEDGELAKVSADGLKIELIAEAGKELKREAETVDMDASEIEKDGHDFFMHKEIFEIPSAVLNAGRGRFIASEGLVKFGGIEEIKSKLRDIDRIIISACGTAAYAGLLGEYFIEELAGIPVEVEIGSEFRYRSPVFTERTALIVVSQSGETADTLAAVREAKEKGILVLGIVNVVGSTIAREVDCGIYTHAGPEIGVASTKAFISQLTVLLLLAIYLGRQRNLSVNETKEILADLEKLPELLDSILHREKLAKKLAKKYKDFTSMAFLGRKYSFPVALEGALKLKEISYIHGEGYPAGEFKHGPIALLDEKFPVFFILPSDDVYEKSKSNLEEIKARQAPVIAIVTEGNKELMRMADDVLEIPKIANILSPFLSTLWTYLFAYHVADMKNLDVDKPRNLAKSVTVE